MQLLVTRSGSLSSANEILRRRSKARFLLESLLEQPGTVNVIHYACESFENPTTQGSPRITAIAIRRLQSAQTITYSLSGEAAEAKLSTGEIDDRLDELERRLLSKFYNYVEQNGNHNWLHWNMRDSTFGFNAIASRFSILGGTPIAIPDGQLFDLARSLV